MELTEQKLKEIDGGASWGLITGIAAAIVYLIGCFSGYTNPNKCNNKGA